MHENGDAMCMGGDAIRMCVNGPAKVLYHFLNSQLILLCICSVHTLTNTFCGDAFDVMSAVSCIARAHMAACC